jgi:hypothetical protein
MGTGSFLGVKSSRGVTLTPQPRMVPLSRKGRTVPLFSLWTVQPVQSLSACTRVHFTFYLFMFPTVVVFRTKYSFSFTFLESVLYFCYVFYKFLGKNMLLTSKIGLFLKHEHPTGCEIIQEKIFPKRS